MFMQCFVTINYYIAFHDLKVAGGVQYFMNINRPLLLFVNINMQRD